MDINTAELTELGFENSGYNISFTNNQASYNLSNNNQEQDQPMAPGVYLWLQKTKAFDCYKVVYVGKYKKSVRARLKQHSDGYNRAANGNNPPKGVEKLNQTLQSGGAIEVWFKTSPIIECFGTKVFKNSLEEEALILKYKPPLNSASPCRPSIARLFAIKTR